jgi:site-specific recombinase XerD
MKRALGDPEILPSEARHKDPPLDASLLGPPSAAAAALETPSSVVAAAAPPETPSPPDSIDLIAAAAAAAAAGAAPDGTGWAQALAVAVGQSGGGAAYLVKAPAFDDLRHLAVHAGPDSLPFFAAHYLDAKVVGGSPHTLDAKSRDLKAFIAWFAQANGTLSARGWRPRDTRSYLGHLLGQRRAPTTINRQLATLRHFARWLQDDHALFGTLGLPTREIKDVPVDEPSCKKLSDEEVRALFKAAEDRVMLLDARRTAAAVDKRQDPTRRARPRRDFAMMALLYYCGLRASEQMMLRLSQYSGTHLVDVARKGRNVTRRLFLPVDGRRILDDYLGHERPRDDPEGSAPALFVSTGQNKGYLLRTDLADALNRIAAEANKHRPSPRQIHVTPHKFRHTFGSRLRDRTGSDAETAAALGHQSTKYVPRYTRKTDDEREALLEEALGF